MIQTNQKHGVNTVKIKSNKVLSFKMIRKEMKNLINLQKEKRKKKKNFIKKLKLIQISWNF
jgi:hypothetical protein